MDKTIFDTGFRTMCSAIGYRFESEEKRLEATRVYYQFLVSNEFTDEDWKKTVGIVSTTWNRDYGKHIPTVADILELSGRSARAMAKKALKWLKIQKRKLGYNHPIEFKKEKKSLVLRSTLKDLGGWVKYCQLDSVDEIQFNKRFLELYERKFINNEFDTEKTFLLGVSDLKNQSF